MLTLAGRGAIIAGTRRIGRLVVERLAAEGVTPAIVYRSSRAAAATPFPGYLPYLTGKAAVHFLTRAFAVELASYGILVNAISPGPTMRPGEVSGSEWHDNLQRTPLRRESSATEMAELIATLL